MKRISEHSKLCRRRFCRHLGVVEEPAERSSLPEGLSSVPWILMEPMARRLRFAAGIAALLWIGYLIAFVHTEGNWTWGSTVIGGASLVASLAVLGFTHRTTARGSVLAGVGTAYLLLIALGLALTELVSPHATGVGASASWSAVWIVLFPMLVPCGPRKTLVKTLIAATMTPVAFYAAGHLGGHAMPTLSEQILTVAPVYVAAAVATVGAQLLMGLGTQVANARQMGMYELQEPLASGGMGEIWKAKHQLLTRPAAVKLVKNPPTGSGSPTWVLDEVAQKRFEREAQVTANLQSPHTVQLYDFGVTQSGTYYYVMELLDGVDLDALVKREGPLDPKRVVHILKQSLDSLAEAHAHGLVHRDIKPANIHISRRGLHDDFVKVLDFGLVKQDRAEGTRANLTAQNSINGTPAYMPPEMATGEGAVDGRADLYALGAVAYFLLTGKLIFEARSAMQMAIAHVTERPIPPSQRTAQKIPKGLERIVLQCLEKAPDDRPESAMALLRSLEAINWGAPDEAPVAAASRTAAPPSNALN